MDEQQYLTDLQQIKKRRLQELELRQARRADNLPVDEVLQIDDLRKELVDIESKLANLEVVGPSSTKVVRTRSSSPNILATPSGGKLGLLILVIAIGSASVAFFLVYE